MVRMSSVWDRATEFVGDNLSTLLPFALLILIATAVQDLIGQAISPVMPAMMLAGYGITILIVLIALFARLAVVALALDDRRTGGAAAAIAAGRLLAMVGVLILLGIVFVVLVAPLAIVPVASGLRPEMFQLLGTAALQMLSPGALAFMSIYGLFLLLLLFWAMARLALIPPVLVAEGVAFGSIARSFALTRGMTLRILGVLILLGIVGSVAVLAARTVFGSVLRLALGGTGPASVTGIVTAIVAAAIATLFGLLRDAFISKLYLAATAATPDDIGA